jgi:glycosyltransferase involved in cell wall biosynthesis
VQPVSESLYRPLATRVLSPRKGALHARYHGRLSDDGGQASHRGRLAQLTVKAPMDAKLPIFINTRSHTAGLSGVQRYAVELLRRIGSRLTSVAPWRAMQGVKGHLWEQTVLPSLVRNGLLWSPANSGPLAVSRQVLTVHDVASLDHPEWYSPTFAAWYRWMTPRLVRRVRRVITLSEFSKKRLLALTSIDESSVVVIGNGADGRFCPRSTQEVERVRQSLNIPSPYYVLSLGTLEPRKNLRRLLAAWASCILDLPDEVWLVIAGASGSSRVFSCPDLGSLPPRVHITGFVADCDLPALYSGALALAYVSLYEGFGLPALEAMACGTIPVVANNTALPEVIGDAGLLVNPFDSDAIAAGIKRVVQDPGLRQELKLRAIKRSGEFSWERAADLTWDVISGEALESGSRTYAKDRNPKVGDARSVTAVPHRTVR